MLFAFLVVAIILLSESKVFASNVEGDTEEDDSVFIPLKDLKELPMVKKMPGGNFLKNVIALAAIAIAPNVVKEQVKSMKNQKTGK